MVLYDCLVTVRPERDDAAFALLLIFPEKTGKGSDREKEPSGRMIATWRLSFFVSG